MPNSSILALAQSGSTVKAWCLTGMNLLVGTTPVLGSKNLINGYNLQIDDAVMQAAAASRSYNISTGPIRFSFITPMKDTKYKVFLSPKTVSASAGVNYADGGRALFTHALNDTQFKKETTGFWVRFGIMLFDPATIDTFAVGLSNSSGKGSILNRWSGNQIYQLQVVVI